MRALDVHFQLMQRLGVRSIPARREFNYDTTVVLGDARNSGRRSPGEVARLHNRIQVMAARGMERFEIAEALSVSTCTVDRHLYESQPRRRTQNGGSPWNE